MVIVCKDQFCPHCHNSCAIPQTLKHMVGSILGFNFQMGTMGLTNLERDDWWHLINEL